MPRTTIALLTLLALLQPAVNLVELPFAGAADAAQRPNVLFIIADDLNNDLGCYGNPDVKSPNIDALAAAGVRFDRAYCQYPQCNPSRSSFLTGLRPDTTHIFNNDVDPRKAMPKALYMPNFFKQQGYFTATIGKVTHYYGIMDTSLDAKRPKAGKVEKDTDAADAETPDGQTARLAVELMKKNKDKPFFLAVGFHKPHEPLVVPPKYYTYKAADLKLLNPPAGYPRGVPVAALDTSRGSAGDEANRRKTVADYYACITFVDGQVGFVMKALDDLKLREKTVVVLIGDHGWLHGEHGGNGKQSLFEQSARAPMIICAPGKKSGVVSPRLVEFVDIFPTLTSLCGIPTPANLEGTDVSPLLDDPDRAWKKAAFVVTARSEFGTAKKKRNPATDVLARSVRTERYVFNDWGDGKSFEFYDHQSDPAEYINLVDDPKFAGQVAEMKAMLKAGWKAALPASPTR